MACDNCKRRKVRCDNQPDACSNCKLYSIDCVYSRDKRRRPRQQLSQHAGLTRIGSSPTRGQAPTSGSSNARSTTANAQQRADVRISLDDANSLFEEIQDRATEDARAMNSEVPSDTAALITAMGDLQSHKAVDFWMNIVGTSQSIASRVNTYSRAPQTLTPSEEMDQQRDLNNAQRDASRPHSSRPSELSILDMSLCGPAADMMHGQPRQGQDIAPHTRQELSHQPSTMLSEHASPITLAALPGHWAARKALLRRDERGRSMYFGTTSNLDLDRIALAYGPQQVWGTQLRNAYARVLNTSKLNWSEDQELELYLRKQYFLWDNPLLNIVDESIYTREKQLFEQGGDTVHYSPMLNNAICALGSCHSARVPPVTESGSANADFFAARTKAFLDLEMDQPTLATVQALLILSLYEAGQASDARGYLYSGMATRISYELGLHVDTAISSGREMCQIRQRLKAAIGATETFWAISLGKPLIASLYDTRRLFQIPTRETTFDAPPVDGESPASLVQERFYSLSSITAQILRTLYIDNQISLDEQRSFVASVNHRLHQWKGSLPHTLQPQGSTDGSLSTGKDAAILQLHIHYCTATILLNRVLIETPSDDLSPAVQSAEPFQTCSRSANEMCRLLKMYTTLFSAKNLHVESVHATLTAGLILLVDAQRQKHSNTPEISSTWMDNLTVCLQTLGEQSTTFKSSLRALDILLSARRELNGYC